MGLQHYTQDMSKIPLKYNKKVLFYTREVCQNIITKWTCQFMDLTNKAMIVVSSLGF